MNPIEIIYELKKLGISQVAIARELEVATGVVGNVIHGRITAHQIACHIANLLGKSIHELWPGKYVFKSRGAHATRGKVMSDNPLPWSRIPAKSRSLFDFVVFFYYVLAMHRMAACDDAPAAYRWECLLYENGWPDEFNWKDDNCSVVACYADNFVQPLIKLGLVAVVQRGFVDFYAPTSKGVATWERAIKDGKIPERD